MMRWAFVMMVLAGPALAAPINYQLPEETASFAPGPNLAVVQNNCGACHSAEYISTQPRNNANPRAFWQASVTKMKAVFGAPIDAEDAPKIVDYLAQTYP